MSHVNVKLKANWAAADVLIRAAADALAATGQDIAEKAREAMTPGHFFDTGLSQDETRYEQLTDTSGQVHIPTDYSAYPEFGTVRLSPRPVLGPAVDECWPERLHTHWDEARHGTLDPHPAPGPAMDPISRADRTTGGGTP